MIHDPVFASYEGGYRIEVRLMMDKGIVDFSRYLDS
jgi:hypothetical protein